ncbi:hypothetical protein VP1G_11175 [Cytospora mali]|uniref:Uncharacterized protein n=1 Tax=Cytospora mali TaxID=578113 RepID=A0A194V9B3_CYTMA|nr:hypothetical protein VP1G_11175 [Valsa mali var. pyri (nom. inval.)]
MENSSFSESNLTNASIGNVIIGLHQPGHLVKPPPRDDVRERLADLLQQEPLFQTRLGRLRLQEDDPPAPVRHERRDAAQPDDDRQTTPKDPALGLPAPQPAPRRRGLVRRRHGGRLVAVEEVRQLRAPLARPRDGAYGRRPGRVAYRAEEVLGREGHGGGVLAQLGDDGGAVEGAQPRGGAQQPVQEGDVAHADHDLGVPPQHVQRRLVPEEGGHELAHGAAADHAHEGVDLRVREGGQELRLAHGYVAVDRPGARVLNILTLYPLASNSAFPRAVGSGIASCRRSEGEMKPTVPPGRRALGMMMSGGDIVVRLLEERDYDD